MKHTITESQLKNIIYKSIMNVLNESMDDEMGSFQDDVEYTEEEPWIKVNLSEVARNVFGEMDETFLEDLYTAIGNDKRFDGEFFVIYKWESYYGEHTEENDDEKEAKEELKNGLMKLKNKYDFQNLKKFYKIVNNENQKQKV